MGPKGPNITHHFGRWISDNREATILIQHEELPDGDIRTSDASILGRVSRTTSDDDTKMVLRPHGVPDRGFACIPEADASLAERGNC